MEVCYVELVRGMLGAIGNTLANLKGLNKEVDFFLM